MAERKVIVCPNCHVQLEMLPSGHLCCRSCGKVYAVLKQNTDGSVPLSSAVARVRSPEGNPAQAAQKKGIPTALLILLLLILLMALALGGLFFYRSVVGTSDPRAFDQAELDSYLTEAAANPPAGLTTGKSDSVRPGEPASVTGAVKSVGEDFVTLDNGVSCYGSPDALGPDGFADFQAALGQLSPGDVVSVDGLACSRRPLTLKYCNLPRSCYGGMDYYRGYDAFLGGVPFPDTRFDPAVYNGYQDLLREGNHFPLGAEQISAAYGAAHTDSGVQAVADTYLHQAITVNGAVTDLHEGWFIIENNIYCFYVGDQLSEDQLAEFLALTPGQKATVTGYCTDTSPDMTRLSYCTMGVPGTPSAMAAPQVPEGSAEGSGLADLAGEWWQADGTRSHFTLTPLSDDTFSIKENASSGAADSTTLELTASYDPNSGKYLYHDAKKIHYLSENDEMTETVEYENGVGSFYLDDGFLYWVDDMEGSDATGIAYQKDF